MLIPFYTSWIVQLVINVILIIFLIYILYLLISLVIKVKKERKVDKRKEIKKILILLGIAVLIFTSVNIFFQYDPFNIVEDKPKVHILE